MPEWLLPVIFGGVVQSIMTYGALRVELRWLHANDERIERRIEQLERERVFE